MPQTGFYLRVARPTGGLENCSINKAGRYLVARPTGGLESARRVPDLR